jgi:hypothetical protein
MSSIVRSALILSALVGMAPTTSAQLYVAPTAGSIETRTWDSGALQTFLYVGYAGHGTFIQSGGTVSGGFILGVLRGGAGTYLLTNGALNTTRGDVGFTGTGTFIQSGGTHNLVGVLSISLDSTPGAFGAYFLTGANATFTTDFELIARHNPGTFTQSAGYHEVRERCAVGYLHRGQYDMSGGILNVGGELDVGRSAASTFNHSGGTVTVGASNTANGLLWIGDADGSYNLSAPSATLVVWGRELIGYNGRGIFHQSAGSHFVNTSLSIAGSRSGNVSRFLLDGGTLEVNELERIGEGSTLGAFQQSGGTHTAHSEIALGANGTYALSGGTVVTPLLSIANGGSFTWSGGALDVSSLTLAGRMNVTVGSGRTLVVDELTIDPHTGRLDLGDNNLVIDYADDSPIEAMKSLRTDLRSGALFSSAGPEKRLAYADNAVLEWPSFAGVSFPPGDFTQLLVMGTYAGDTNLDGVVDMMDLASLAPSWQTSADWLGGDFDYNGTVDVNDLGLLASNWQTGVGNPLGPSLSDALSSLGLPMVSVPEPAQVGLLLATLALKCHRRRGRN